jgi:hypothetical protein
VPIGAAAGAAGRRPSISREIGDALCAVNPAAVGARGARRHAGGARGGSQVAASVGPAGAAGRAAEWRTRSEPSGTAPPARPVGAAASGHAGRKAQVALAMRAKWHSCHHPPAPAPTTRRRAGPPARRPVRSDRAAPGARG